MTTFTVLHSTIITSIWTLYKSKPNSFSNSRNIPNIQTPNYICNNLRLTHSQNSKTSVLSTSNSSKTNKLGQIYVHIFIRKKCKNNLNIHLRHKPNAPKWSSTSSIKNIIAKSNVNVTYPLDSLPSDRALGSACPLLGALIHQLPTLNPHINTSPYQPQNTIFKTKQKKKSEKS
jgi:hypothetical protein